MNQYPETTRAILMTNVSGGDDNVMVFTSLTVEQLAGAYQDHMGRDVRSARARCSVLSVRTVPFDVR